MEKKIKKEGTISGESGEMADKRDL